MRDYITMRNVLAVAASAKGDLCYNDFRSAAGQDDDVLEGELERLSNDSLLKGDVQLRDDFGKRRRCVVSGLTAEGREFYKLIENDEVWMIILATLRKADIDIFYPLLKEVCEEIVKRYVTSCIPDIPSK